MRVVRNRHPLPLVWGNHPRMPKLVDEFDVPISSLFAKVLIFRTTRDLIRAWGGLVGRTSARLNGRTRAAVNGLYYEVVPVSEIGKEGRRYLEVDPRYFCVMGFAKKWLSMEVIAHESVHAGFCYAKRKTRNPWQKMAKEMDEEAIAYPAGLIARRLNNHFHRRAFYS